METQPSSSSSSSLKKKKKNQNEIPKNQQEQEVKMSVTGGFGLINEDLIQNILKRLPAVSLASASCVSKTWNQICNRILFSRPKLSSALSLHPSSHIAVQEVLGKVLSEPIRPHFAIANVVGRGFPSDMVNILHILAKKLGSKTPIILTSASGIMGTDTITNEFREVMSGDDYSDCDDEEDTDENSGIVLTVGFVPGLKVDAIPLLRPKKAPQVSMVDNFVMDIRNYAASVSGCTSPVGIIMFGDASIDQKPTVEKLDYAMSTDTIIVGDERCQFLYRSGTESRNVCGSKRYCSDAVALVFARDQDKPHGIGEIQFHAAVSKGVSAIGPQYKAASVRVNSADCCTWLTARRDGEQEILDGQRVLNDINDELENRTECPALFIGITKRRKFFIGSEKSKLMTFLAFHGVRGGDEEYLFVDGVGIRTGDYFQFYQSDPNTALSSCNNVSENLRRLKLDWSNKNFPHPRSEANNVGRKEFLGGFVFSCCGRGKSFFGRSNVDSSPVSENLPGVPLAGIFCGGEIGRGFSILSTREGQEESAARCSLHVYSTVYLVVSYTPATLGQ